MTKHHTKWMNHWIDVVVVTLTILVISDRLHKVNASSADGGYVNPCNAFGTADKLNALYRGLGPDESCSGGPSFKCSGVFIRTGLGHENSTYQGKGGIADYPNIFNIEDPIYSIGVETLTSAVCPPDIVDGAEYPGFCPDPAHIYVGSMSFSYIRQDLAPPISLLKEWEETGVDPISGISKEKWDWGPSVAWPGGGYILLPEDVYDANPDVVLPDSDGQPSSFWNFDRVGNFWPMDGASYSRTFCGNGPSWGDMYIGIDGPIVPPAHILYGANACPHDAAGWENLAIPENYTGSCPASVAESVESYYEHWFSNVEKAFDGIDCTSSEHKEIGNDVCNLLVLGMKIFPQQVACGLAPEYFDQTMIPLAKTMPLKVILERLEQCNTQNGTMCEFGFGLWNEVTIKSWNGIGLSDLAAHLVVWYDDEDGSKDLAYTRAKEFYDASGLNGGPNIRIPVVYRNNSKLFDDPDDVDSDIVFSCPDENNSNTDSVEEGNPLSSSGPFTFINLSLIVSVFVVFAI